MLPENICTELLEKQRTYPIKVPTSPCSRTFKLQLFACTNEFIPVKIIVQIADDIHYEFME